MFPTAKPEPPRPGKTEIPDLQCQISPNLHYSHTPKFFNKICPAVEVELRQKHIWHDRQDHIALFLKTQTCKQHFIEMKPERGKGTLRHRCSHEEYSDFLRSHSSRPTTSHHSSVALPFPAKPRLCFPTRRPIEQHKPLQRHSRRLLQDMAGINHKE